jgi:hypothetical protein
MSKPDRVFKTTPPPINPRDVERPNVKAAFRDARPDPAQLSGIADELQSLDRFPASYLLDGELPADARGKSSCKEGFEIAWNLVIEAIRAGAFSTPKMAVLRAAVTALPNPGCLVTELKTAGVVTFDSKPHPYSVELWRMIGGAIRREAEEIAASQSPTTQPAAAATLTRTENLAWSQFDRAAKDGGATTDDSAFAWLSKHDDDFAPTSKDAWLKAVGRARRKLGLTKRPGFIKGTGRSIVHRHEI